MIKEIHQCRVCKNPRLVSVLYLGDQALTSIFPKSKKQNVPLAPLELVKCDEKGRNNRCGLLQLRHSFDKRVIYSGQYGYKSGLNQSMKSHLTAKARRIVKKASLDRGDLIIDVGSNDGTLLNAYPRNRYNLVGIDPTAKKFSSNYHREIHIVPEFFSSKRIKNVMKNKKGKIVTSIAMFYDVEDPLDFMEQIEGILEKNGIWVLEQNYLPTMLSNTAYDNICHEHLSYFGLKQIKWMADRTGLKIIDIEQNDVNGGSLEIVLSKCHASFKEKTGLIQTYLNKEKRMGLDTLKPYERFRRNVYRHRTQLCQFFNSRKDAHKTIIGYGASTKGNVMLQFCGLTQEQIPCIAEINEDKFGSFTPGSRIPIISETQAKTLSPDYYFVFPWHFRENFLGRERHFLNKGGQMVLPLPTLEIVQG